MAFQPFAVEQFLSETEHGVRFNFSESGVHPMRLGELCTMAGIEQEALFDTLLDYPQVNGFDLLRTRIAQLYEGAGPENVLVTVGATEANTLVANTLLAPGDRVVALPPTYGQLPGNALNLGQGFDIVHTQFVDVHKMRARLRVISRPNSNRPI
ncbi:MAG: aminotransferase class I/II-fold pyridoxal phosphate-dependent enzyme, partial [Pseudomonadota bacterium]